MAIITISRQAGSLGDEIAKSVAEQLNYDLIDKQRMSAALTDQGVKVHEVEKYDEKKPSIWQAFSEQRKRVLHLIQAAVYGFAAQQNVVIVGRGGQILLKGLPGTLHVRIIALFQTRLKRIMTQEACFQNEAEQFLLQSDRNSSGFINSYLNADWEDQNLYDLIINTRTMTEETGVKLITAAVGTLEFEEKSHLTAEKLSDLSLTRKAEAALLGIAGLDVTHLRIEKGVAAIYGLAQSETLKKECLNSVSKIEGITRVENKLRLVDVISI